MRVVGYRRCSTSEQADSGLGLQAQAAAIEAEATRRGWDLIALLSDEGVSGKSLRRAGLVEALALVEGGAADVLCVSKLDRLSRSLVDFAGLMQRAQRCGWQLVALDVNIDTTTAAGALVANVMASVAEWERRTIGERTKAALQVKRDQGVALGRPREISTEARSRILDLHGQGYRVSQIARQLNEEGVATPRRGTWHSPGVKRVLSWETS